MVSPDNDGLEFLLEELKRLRGFATYNNLYKAARMIDQAIEEIQKK
jgi:predicted transcriptional regulator